MFKRKFEEMELHIERGGFVSFGRGEVTLNCVRGTLWVTWPGSGDVILREGDEISVRQHGKVCITSFTDAFIQINRKPIFPSLRDIPRLAAAKIFTAVASYARDGDNHSVFGDSVHSITR